MPECEESKKIKPPHGRLDAERPTKEQREMYVRQLHEMERANEPNLPDMDVGGDAPVSPEPDLPEPDYQDEEERNEDEDNKKYKYPVILPAPDTGKNLGGDGTGSGEIQPKKLVNPVLQSRDHQKLHREMMMNQKLGIDVLNKKSELRKTFDNKKMTQAKKAKDEETQASKNPFQLKLEQQAQKLKLYEEREESLKSPKDVSPPAKSPTSPKVALKPAAKNAKKPEQTDQNQNQSEFLRVHSKIKKNPTS